MLLIIPLLLSGLVGAASASCSSGDTNYMCANLDRCWHELGFGSKDDLKYLCDVQGIPTNGGGSTGFITRVQITVAPRSQTVAPGASAQFACTASDAVKVFVVPEMEAQDTVFDHDMKVTPSTQKVIQVGLTF